MWWKRVNGKPKQFAAAFASLLTLIMTAAIVTIVSNQYWPRPPLNVIVVTFDTTRADHLGAYGYQQGLTSSFDEFARRGVVFERGFAPAPITLPSHTTMFTGLYPPEHGLRLNGEGKLPERIPVLAEILKKQGYDTAAFIAAFVLDRQFGLARGFDTYDDDLSKAKPGTDYQERRRDGHEIVNSALAWLGKRTKRPFFCWIHLFDAHGPYEMRSAEFGQQFESHPYDAGIAVELRAFDRLVSYLREQKLDENTLVIVAADHGEGLDEHMENEHSMLVYNTTMHVPIVFVNPRLCRPGHRVSSTVSLVDLMPTVLDLLQIPAPAHVSGRSLRTALAGHPIDPVAGYGEAETPYALNRWCPLTTVISDRWKYIQTNRPELYDLQNDPNELTNLAETNVSTCREMKNILEIKEDSFLKTRPTEVTLTESEKAKLASLGYVAGSQFKDTPHRDDFEGLPDVKDMLPYLAKYEKARLHGLKDEYTDAVPLLEEIVRERPDYSAAVLLLGNYQFNLRQYDDAVTTFRAVIAQSPHLLSARMNLARTFAVQSRYEEAAAELREVINREPENSFPHFQLAQMLVSLKQFDDAMLQFREAIRISPNYVPAHVELGKLLVQLDRPKEAVPEFQQALDIEPAHGVGLMNLVKLLVQFRDYDTALVYCERSARLAGYSFEMRLNLGLLLTLKGTYPEAIAELREAQRMRPDDPRPAHLILQGEAAL